MSNPSDTPADPLREAFLAGIRWRDVRGPTADALVDWKFEKAADQTFETYLVQAPNGYTAAVSALDRNPANVLFLLAKAMVRALATKPAETAYWKIIDKDGRIAAMVGTEDGAIAEQAWQDENNARFSPHRIEKPGTVHPTDAL